MLPIGQATDFSRKVDPGFLQLLKKGFGGGADPVLAWTVIAVLAALIVLVFVLYRRRAISGLFSRLFLAQRARFYCVMDNDKCVLDRLALDRSEMEAYREWKTGRRVHAGRVVVASIGPRSLRVKFTDREDLAPPEPGDRLTLAFYPVLAGGRRVNGFTTEIKEFDPETGEAKLQQPDKLRWINRRAQPRKKLTDQRYMKAKLWRGGPEAGEPDYLLTPPEAAVNHGVPRPRNLPDDEIVNVSRRGMALVLYSPLPPGRLAKDAPVVVNIEMYSAKSEGFESYWYAGEVASLQSEGEAVRLGIRFTHVGRAEPGPPLRIRWSSL